MNKPWEFQYSFVVPNILHSSFNRRIEVMKKCFLSLLSSVKTFGNETNAIFLPVTFSKWYRRHAIQVFYICFLIYKVKLCLITFLFLVFLVWPSCPPIKSVEVNRDIPGLFNRSCFFIIWFIKARRFFLFKIFLHNSGQYLSLIFQKRQTYFLAFENEHWKCIVSFFFRSILPPLFIKW